MPRGDHGAPEDHYLACNYHGAPSTHRARLTQREPRPEAPRQNH